MSVTFGFYNSVDSDRRYNATDFGAIFDGVINDGVFASIGDQLAVKPSSNMNISVGTGRAWFRNTWTKNDALLILAIDLPDMILNRIDTIVLEVNSSDNVRANTIKVIKGTPMTFPTPPVLENTTTVRQYPLAHISVPVGITAITNSHITNKVGTVDCPFVTGPLTVVSIDNFVAQWGSQWTDWFNTIQGQLTEDAAGNLQNQLNSRSNRNGIINGAMTIWQRGTASIINPGVTTYIADRFCILQTMAKGFDISQEVLTPSANFPFQYAMRFQPTAGAAASEAWESAYLSYKMEGYDYMRFAKQQVTLSFWVNAVQTGTYCVAISGASFKPSYVHEYTILQANTWEKKTVTLTLDPSSVPAANLTSAALHIRWALHVGANLMVSSASKDTWVANQNYIGTENAVNMIINPMTVFKITGVQLELGATATPFEFRPFSQELALCMRYYEKSYKYEDAPGLANVFTTGNIWDSTVWRLLGNAAISEIMPALDGRRKLAKAKFLVPKRANPSMKYWDGAGNQSKATTMLASGEFGANNISDPTQSVYGSTTGIVFQMPVSSYGYLICWAADSEL